MFGISKNVKYIAVAPGASKLPALKEVRPRRGLNPGRPRSIVNIENEEEFGVYSKQKRDPLFEKTFSPQCHLKKAKNITVLQLAMFQR